MRNYYTRILKSFFSTKVHNKRKDLGISQEEMAQKLVMGCRGYAKLDSGQICCSALTLSLYLIYVCDEPLVFLQELRYALENNDSDVA